MDTIDETDSVIPESSYEEIKAMCGWITFAGVVTIVLGLFGTISAWSALKLEGNLFNAISFLVNLCTPYLGYLLMSKASSFKKFVEQRNLSDLKQALSHNKKYFMFSTYMVLLTIVVNLIAGLM